MPARIYALAKELKLDSKVLVDLCAKAGVTGKGSALASLTDEEVVRVKAYVAGGASKPVKEAPVAAPKPGVAAPRPAPEAPALRRSDYIPPTGTAPAGRPPVIGSKPQPLSAETPKKPAAEGPKGPPVRVAPTIRVAPMPTVQQPVAQPKADEPPPQKPDIKLPPDAIRASKAGAKPLQAHLKKQELKRKAEQAAAVKPSRPSGPGRPGAPSGAPAAPGEGERRDRSRRGKAPAAATGADSMMGTREARQRSRKRTGGPGRPGRIGVAGEEERPLRRPRPRQKKSGVNTAAPRKGHVVIQLPCNVRSFSAAIGIPVPKVLSKLLSLGMMSSVTADLNAETIELLAVEFGAEVEVRQAFDLEDQLLTSIESQEDAPETLELRPPVVTFLGHVDHGKTSLLDRIIGIDVVCGEKRRHHAAHPGLSRSRRTVGRSPSSIRRATRPLPRCGPAGANVTDIAVLVVAADDGVMPQTEEAISHARAAGVPIVVALNKIDLPGVNVDRIMQQLAANELLPSEWGGETEVVKTSAMTGEGIDDLLETLLTVAELHEYKANPRPRRPTAPAWRARCTKTAAWWPSCWFRTARCTSATSSSAARPTAASRRCTTRSNREKRTKKPALRRRSTSPGLTWRRAPASTSTCWTTSRKRATLPSSAADASRRVALQRSNGSRHARERSTSGWAANEVQTLNMILRADVRGSIEAIRKELTKLQHPEVQIKILQATVGGITEADVHLADASDAVIIGFNVVPDEGARLLADQRGVQIRRYDIIYQVTDDLKAALEGMLKPEKREVELGRALVQQTFHISRLGTIAGCRVLAGTIQRNCRVRVIRESRIIGDYPLDSLKREKDDAREVREGLECGMKLDGFNDLKEGDILEAYKIEEFARTL